MFHVPNHYRIRSGSLRSTDDYGNEGAFKLPAKSGSRSLICIASDAFGWDHVSVTVHVAGKTVIPTWAEMQYVKEQFWDDEDTVIQFHPRASEYVNVHPHVLHLWRPTASQIPTPPRVLV